MWTRSRGLRRLPRPDPAERAGVMTEVGPHRDGQGEMLGRQAQFSRPAGGQSETELCVVVAGVDGDQRGEAGHRVLVAAGVVLRAGEGFADAAGCRLGVRGPAEQSGRRVRMALDEQLQTTLNG